jgi:N-methylhydantoinase A/oxoprolinase/acetone carboxylase beta subunit
VTSSPAPVRDLAVGIDTGGTCTDAVVVTYPETRVVAAAKALTTPHDLAIGVGQALDRVLDHAGEETVAQRVAVVGLSTTLATNAIVEGVGDPVCLILIGYDAQLLRRFDLEQRLVTEDVVHIDGGHDGAGHETAPLDEAAVARAVEERRGRVRAFAVSGYFSVRKHEQRARRVVAATAEPDVAVTCAHELTGELDSVRRATTAALNAGLLPLLRRLVATVRGAIAERGLSAPLMVVKGDGSMVSADFAIERAVETVLSGPAASVVGASHLCGRADAWVVDVGGTTTDVAVLRDGLPRLDTEGAWVGGWRTMVETVRVHTLGLGGDSHVRVEPGSATQVVPIGPRRVVPLAVIAGEDDAVRGELRRQLREGTEAFPGEFIVAVGGTTHGLADADRELLEQLGSRPRSLDAMAAASPYGRLSLQGLSGLERRRAALRCGFTPTDALHVLGRYTEFDVEAATSGAELLGAFLGLSAVEFSQRVVDGLSQQLAVVLAGQALADEGEPAAWEADPGARALLQRAFGHHPDSDLACRLELRRPLVAVGAPVEAYAPGAAEHLHAVLDIPKHAAVANAVGAVAGGVVRHLRVPVRPTERDGVFHVLLPSGVVAVRSLNDGVAVAQERVPPYLQSLLEQAGADGVEVRVARDDRSAPLAGRRGEALIEVELVFTAVGKPRLDGELA